MRFDLKKENKNNFIFHGSNTMFIVISMRHVCLIARPMHVSFDKWIQFSTKFKSTHNINLRNTFYVE